MPIVNLIWKPTENANVQEAFVGDASNKAFTLTNTGGGFALDSHLTRLETKGSTFGTEVLAKEYANTLIVENNIPQFGTIVNGSPDDDVVVTQEGEE